MKEDTSLKVRSDEPNFQTRIGAGASPIRDRIGEFNIRLAFRRSRSGIGGRDEEGINRTGHDP